MSHATSINLSHTLTRMEGLLGVFLSLLIPAMTAGFSLPELTAMMLK
jgi:hypothetical protein